METLKICPKKVVDSTTTIKVVFKKMRESMRLDYTHKKCKSDTIKVVFKKL